LTREGRARLVVDDDGRFDEATPSGRLGLAGSRQPAELLGGRRRGESSPDSETAVIVDLETP
jgi:signal transduction histidine kinase